jgi:hypothetical protein
MTSQDERKLTGRLHSCACVIVANFSDEAKPTGRLYSCACVMIACFSDEALTIPKATVLGIAEGISESLVDKINARSETDFIEPAKPPSIEKERKPVQQIFAREIGPPKSGRERAY